MLSFKGVIQEIVEKLGLKFGNVEIIIIEIEDMNEVGQRDRVER